MTEMIKLIHNHRTYSEFDEAYLLSDEDLNQILSAARQAPSWMNGQFYSILVLKDKKKREQLVEWNPTNSQILKSSVFLVFLADLNRTKIVSDHYQENYVVEGNLDALLMATTDAALACQNALLAAESLGLGGCVIGSIRKQADKIIPLLNLPQYVVPVFGLVIGRPLVEMKVKPRLPETAVVHYESYIPSSMLLIEAYDQVMSKFGEARETKLWSKKFSDYFAEEWNPCFNEVLKKQKLL